MPSPLSPYTVVAVGPPLLHYYQPEFSGNFSFWSLYFIMSNIPEWKQLQEAEYFNWRYLICNILAKSPLHLEDQFLVEHGVCVDVDGTEWVKCHKCFSLYHLASTQDPPPLGEYYCSFLECKCT